jgi:hypothetical protein
MDVLTISPRLGHGSPTITLRIYGHLFGKTDARAAEIMEAIYRLANRVSTKEGVFASKPLPSSGRSDGKPQ